LETTAVTELQAYDSAVEYMRAKGIIHYGCLHRGARQGETGLGLTEHDFPAGIRRKLWFFTFAGHPPPPPNVVISGGDDVVYVDDDTSLCGYMWTL
jgi:hypothetical protein